MRNALAIAATVASALALSPGDALAFQEMPVPAPQISIPGQGPASEGLTFEAPATPPSAPKTGEKDGGAFGSLNLLPKLDFGLELLYGQSGADAARNRPVDPPAASTEGDVQILGTVKRRF